MSEQFSFITAAMKGRIRGGAADGDDKVLSANQNSELLVAQGLPNYTEMVRRFPYVQVQTETLFAALVAVPTTTASLEIWVNIASDSTFVVESLFADQILATAAAQEYAIYAQVTTPKAVPTLTALEIFYVNGDTSPETPTVGSKLVPGAGTTVVANGWRPYGPPHGGALAAATPMGSWEAPIDGRLMVRPGRSLCMAIVGSLATASSFQCGAQGFLVPNSLLAV